MGLTVVILAAGQGTRMKSALPKVLHPLGGLPLVGHVLHAAAQLNPQRICLVIPPLDTQIAPTLTALFPELPLTFATQSEPLGTGHAVKEAINTLGDLSSQQVLILCGDTPALQGTTLETLVQKMDQAEEAAPCLYAMDVPPPHAYGRVLCNEQGRATALVETACATEAERALSLSNTGVILVPGPLLLEFLKQLTPAPTGEYYLTDLVSYAAAQGRPAHVLLGPEEEFCGVNTRMDLAKAEGHLQKRWRQRALEAGVTLMDPSSTYFSYDTVLGQDSVIYPHVYFGPQVTVGARVTIRPFSMLTGAILEEDTRIGPCAHLRPGTHLKSRSRVGNFVEVKNTTLESGAHADHLSYLGDSFVGANAALGAGTITCNYNGFEKFQTHIGAGAFVGSNTTLVAPVTIGEGALVAAGSVITHDVSAEDLVFARAKQISRPGYGKRFRERAQKREQKKEG